MAVTLRMDVFKALLQLCFFFGGVRGALKIVEPLPSHRVVIENETLTVTCVAFDKDNPDVKPLGIDFYRVSQVGETTLITENNGDEGYSITNRTEMNGRKLLVSLLFKRIKSTDDGRYECKIRNTSAVAYGFGITYIPYASLPQISVSPNLTAEFSDEVSLVCNLTTTKKYFINLITLAWIKDGKHIQTVPRPKEGQLKDIDLKITKAEDGGQYECKLSMLLHQFRTYNITRLIVLKVKPRFYALKLRNNRFEIKKGEAVEFNCNATGNPIIIIWKRKPRHDTKNITIDMKESDYNDSHYKISSTTPYQGFKLEIRTTEYTDRGLYYCCLRESNSSVIDKKCQRFSLRIKDPLGYLWPLIGIGIEGIVLFIILVVCKRCRKTDIQSQGSELEQVEFSYSARTDGKEGRIRLRRQAGATTSSP